MSANRCNIHLTLDENLRRWVERGNLLVRSEIPSTIAFDPLSSSIPHVSLLTGKCDSGGRVFNCIADAMVAVTRSHEPLSLELRPPRPGFGGYILADVADPAEIVGVRGQLASILGIRTDLVEVENPPHVTIARVATTADYGPKLERLLSQLARTVGPTVGVAPAIQLSHLGQNGTCIDSVLFERFQHPERFVA